MLNQNAKILCQYFVIAYKNLIAYRINFVFVIIYWFLSLGILVIFWKTLFQYLPQSLGDWSYARLCILNSICYISWGLFVFFWGLHQIPQKVIHGEIDKFLSRPIPLILGLLGEGLRLEAIYEIIAGVLTLGFFSLKYHVDLDGIRLFKFLLALIAGVLIVVFVHGCLSLTSFWFGKIDAIQKLIDEVDDFQKYPTGFYPKSVRFFLMVILPLYFPGTFAAKMYLGMAVPNWHWFVFIGVFVFWLGLFNFLYKACLNQYEANG